MKVVVLKRGGCCLNIVFFYMPDTPEHCLAMLFLACAALFHSVTLSDPFHTRTEQRVLQCGPPTALKLKKSWTPMGPHFLLPPNATFPISNAIHNRVK